MEGRKGERERERETEREREMHKAREKGKFGKGDYGVNYFC